MSSFFLLRNLLRLKGLGLKVRDNTPQTPETLEIHLFADSVTKKLASVDDNGTRTDYLTSAGTGDVNGPASSTDNAIVRFDALTGKVIQDSSVTLSDAGVFSSATFLSPTIANFVNANHDHQAAAGGGQLSHPLSLTTLGWTASGHTGAVNRIAGFDGAGAATQYQIGVDLQAWDADLDALSALAGTGLAVRTGAATWVSNRSIVALDASITVSNGNGVAGDPTLSVPAGSETVVGGVELATQGEVNTGTDPTRVVTAATLSSATSINGQMRQMFRVIGTSLNPTTIATTFVALSQMSQAITPNNASNWVRVAFTGSFSNSNANVYVGIAIFVDGVEQTGTERRQQAPANDRVTISVEDWYQLSAAAHTVEVQWLVEANTGTANDNDRIMIVQEYNAP